MDKFILIKRDGTRQEVPFLIRDGVRCLSQHIYLWEFGQHAADGTLEENVQPVIFEPLIEVFEAVRDLIKRPIKINSGYRSIEKQTALYQAHQEDLKRKGLPDDHAVAKPGHSPHMYGAAMDVAIPWTFNAQNLAALFRKASRDLRYPQARTGFKTYHNAFVHLDVLPMLFEPYTKIPNPDPLNWRPGVMW